MQTPLEARTRDRAIEAARAVFAEKWPGDYGDYGDRLAERIVDGLFAIRAESGLVGIKHMHATVHVINLRRRLSPDGVNDPTTLVGHTGLSLIAQAAAEVIVNAFRRGPRRDHRSPS